MDTTFNDIEFKVITDETHTMCGAVDINRMHNSTPEGLRAFIRKNRPLAGGTKGMHLYVTFSDDRVDFIPVNGIRDIKRAFMDLFNDRLEQMPVSVILEPID